jgi:amidohydrolase
VFQPAEEIMPGGAHDVIEAGGLDGVGRILALHCDPRVDTGQVGLTVGPITSASDRILVRLSGEGGHTARPHLTQDVVHALGVLVSQLPAVLGRRLDPRAGVSLVWGRVNAGHVANAIPSEGWAEGTIRCLDPQAWETAPALAAELAEQLVAPFGVTAEVETYRGVPPVVNDAASVALVAEAAGLVLGPDAVTPTDQSLGAEDFAWYLEHVPGALARLGVRRPGDLRAADLHQGTFDPDEEAIGLAVRLLAACAVMGEPSARPVP